MFRHGQTEWSLSGKHTGRTDIPLTAQGEDEARALIPWVSGIKFDHVYASPRQRAQHTCELVGLKPEIEPELAEWDYGDYEGRLSKDIRTERSGWNVFRDGCPGGETPEQVSARADRLITKLSQLDGNVALFSHGHFSPSLSVRWIGLPITEGQHFKAGTASMSILGYDSSHPETRVISLWNATPRALAG
nr:histidine phosphatase family protein [Aestuariivirga litoralis]